MISQYCRLYHQTKPFSHIVIDLFREAVDKCHAKSAISKFDEHKSDTDSGRSSIHCEKELYGKCEDAEMVKINAIHHLRVTRCTDDKLKALNHLKIAPTNIIGYDNECDTRDIGKHHIQAAPVGSKCLQVISRKNAILKRRNLHRRNTIDSSQFKDVENNRPFNTPNSNVSKSTNCLNRREPYSGNGFLEQIDRMNFMGSSMPGLYY